MNRPRYRLIYSAEMANSVLVLKLRPLTIDSKHYPDDIIAEVPMFVRLRNFLTTNSRFLIFIGYKWNKVSKSFEEKKVKIQFERKKGSLYMSEIHGTYQTHEYYIDMDTVNEMVKCITAILRKTRHDPMNTSLIEL